MSVPERQLAFGPVTRRALLRDERGLSTVEYVVLLVLIVAISVASWSVFGGEVSCRLAGAAQLFDERDSVSLQQCSSPASSGSTGDGRTSSSTARASTSAPRSGSATAGGFASATTSGSPVAAAASAGGPSTGLPMVVTQEGPVASTSTPSSSSSTPSESGSLWGNIKTNVADGARTTYDFATGVVAGLDPTSPFRPASIQHRPGFGNEVAFGVGQALGAGAALVGDLVMMGGGGAGGLATGGAVSAVAISGGVLMVPAHVKNLHDGINLAVHGHDAPPRSSDGVDPPQKPSRSSSSEPPKTAEQPPRTEPEPPPRSTEAFEQSPKTPTESATERAEQRRLTGERRENYVADISDGKVSREVVKTPFGKTDVDVIGKNGEIIAVGGPAKIRVKPDGSLDTSQLGTQLKKNKWLAEQRGTKAQAYFVEATPDEALEYAREQLGPENVFVFKEPL